MRAHNANTKVGTTINPIAKYNSICIIEIYTTIPESETGGGTPSKDNPVDSLLIDRSQLAKNDYKIRHMYKI